MDELREATAEVVRRARYVRIRDEAIGPYAASLPLGDAASPALGDAGSPPLGDGAGAAQPPPGPAGAPADEDPAGSREDRALHWLGLNAINFGSGWFPTLRKRDGLSGYRTIAAGWRERYDADGPLRPAQLRTLTTGEVAEICGQDPGHELIELYTRSLQDLGARLLVEFGGSAAGLVDAAGGSAVALATHLGGWACFADRSRYQVGDRQVGDRESDVGYSDLDPQAGHSDLQELSVPFLKRAQIAAADLERAGVAHWRDTARLTMFADNLVPHVLRLDGVLELDPALVARIGREELIEHGSPEEVELRACAVQAVERIVQARGDQDTAHGVTAAAVDQLLWERGQGPAYKAVPRPRCRCTAY